MAEEKPKTEVKEEKKAVVEIPATSEKGKKISKVLETKEGLDQAKKGLAKIPEKEETKAEKPKEKPVEEKKVEEKTETKAEEKKPEKKEAPKAKKVPKSEAVVNSFNAHLSMKTSAAVCRFIVGKTIDRAVADLQEVATERKPVPMKGEIPHRHGKIMSGRFPRKTAEHFITLLKALAGNVAVNGLEEPVISEAIANIGSRPFGKFGAVRRKRAHIKIIAKNRNQTKFKIKKQKSNKQKEKKK